MTNPAPQKDFRFHPKLLRGLICLAFLVISLFARAAEETADEQYLRIYNQISQADSVGAAGNQDLAKQRYKEALTALQNFKRNNPFWNPAVVSFRLDYLDAKINPRPTPVFEPAEKIVAAPKPEAKPQPKTAPKPPAAPSSPQVKLINPGAEPRKELRIHPKAGDKQNLEMTMKMAMDMGMGQPMKMPATKTMMEVTVKSISANGDIGYEMLMGDVEIAEEPGAMPQVVASMKASLAGIKGLSMNGVMSDHGIVKSLDVKIPAGVSPQMRQGMEQMKESMSNMSSPFPDEAIGVGAEWEVKLPVKSQGMTIDQTTTYKLESLNGNHANVKSRISQNAANQKISNPSMPQMKMDLIEMTGTGTGDLTFDLARFIPQSAALESHSETAMRMNAGGGVQEMSMKMDMNLRMEAK